MSPARDVRRRSAATVRVTLWLATACAALAILGVGCLPGGAIPLPEEGWDKVAHGVAYAVLGGLACLSLRAEGLRGLPAALAALAFAVACGGLDEWHQGLVPGRVTSLADLAADAVGAALGSGGLCRLPLSWLPGEATARPAPPGGAP